MGEIQQAYAESNRCLRARKCALTPYNKSKKTDGGGCCPGQTGHHILPDSMFRDPSPEAMATAKAKFLETYSGTSDKPSLPRDKKPLENCWDKYTEGGAPTICLEGGAHSGSHGTFHKQTERKIDFIRGSNRNLPYTKSRKAVTNIAAKEYGCDKQCLEAQLDDYYKKAHTCGPLEEANVVAHTGKSGGAPKQDNGSFGG